MGSSNRITNHAGPVHNPVLTLRYRKGVHCWMFRFRPSELQVALKNVGKMVVGDGCRDDLYIDWADAAKITKAMRDLALACS